MADHPGQRFKERRLPRANSRAGKEIRMRLMFGLSLFFIFFMTLPAIAAEIILVADPWPPFNCETGKSQEGYIVDVARAVFEPSGHTVIYQNIPWKRALQGTHTGKYSGAIGASKTDGKGLVFPDEELARNVLSFYVRKESAWRFQGPHTIETVSIGVAAGYDYRRWLNDYIHAHRDDEGRVQVISGNNPLVQNLKKLILKRIDVIVDTEAAIRFQAQEMGILDEIKPAGYGTEPAYIYIGFSPKRGQSHELARRLSEGTIKLRKNGQLQMILDRYGLMDWK